jgi:hypothetical protein
MASVTLIKLDRASGESDAAYGRRYARATVAKIEGDNRPAVPIRKHAAPSTADLRADIAKLGADVTSFAVNNRIDEAMTLLAKRDPESTARAGAILRSSPEVYEAYQARMAGERWQAPVAKAAEPAVSGHALTIKKLIETNDMDGLGRLMRFDPTAYATYQHMTQAGLTTAYAEVAKGQQSSGLSSIERSIAEGQAKLAALAKAATAPKVDEPALAEAKGRLRGIFDKLRSRKDTQVAEARAELAELLGTAEGRAAVYDMAVIGHLAAAA